MEIPYFDKLLIFEFPFCLDGDMLNLLRESSIASTATNLQITQIKSQSQVD